MAQPFSFFAAKLICDLRVRSDKTPTLNKTQDAILYLHHFLLQDNKMADMTLLHQDIKDICETTFYGLDNFQTNWNDREYLR